MKYLIFFYLIFFSKLSEAEIAPGFPGISPSWSSAKKVHVGTSFFDFQGEPTSTVWFSLANGVLTETYFPTIDKAQIKDSQIIILTKNGELIDERKMMIHQVVNIGPEIVRLVNVSKDQKFEIHHTFYTANNENTLIDEVKIVANEEGAKFFLLTNSGLKNSGLHDNAIAKNNEITFFENDIELSVKASCSFKLTSVGYVGYSDGYQQLLNTKNIIKYDEALDGNVAGTGELNISPDKGIYKFYLTYQFNHQKKYSEDELNLEKETFRSNWKKYFNNLKKPKLNGDEYIYYRSMYVLRSHEDKKNPGAMIASLSVPWGEEMIHQENNEYGGYHLIWPRDLFHVSLAALYSGDKELALRALGFLKKIQYKSGSWNYGERIIEKNGAFPQNVWTTGKEYWSGLQLDQVAYPIHLFWHLYQHSDGIEKKQLLTEFKVMILDALNFIAKYGPWTGQERWEENFGISPSTFAAATSALLIGEKLFHNEIYKNIANQWLNKPNDNIHTWTFTTNGFYGDGNYYLRIGGCENYLSTWSANDPQLCYVANSGQLVDQRELLDQGFLKLSLFGLISPLDPKINTSLMKVNERIKVLTPKGSGLYRYSFDAYGENGKGRLWPLLNGEQGRFYLEQAKNKTGKLSRDLINKSIYLKNTFKSFANAGGLIPEQVFESTGEGTGGATPLAWSHAEYIKLLWSIERGKNISNPF